MRRPVYIFSSGELKRKGNTLCFVKDGEKKFMPIKNVGEIYVFGELSLNKRLLEFLSSNKITIHFFNYYGYYVGSFYPREHYNSGYIILKQVEHYLDYKKRLCLATKFVKGAIINMVKVLKYYSVRGKPTENSIEALESALSGILTATKVEELMAIEGNARKEYYRAFDDIIEDPVYRFEGRTKRPPRTKLDSLISFGNSLLYTTTLSEIYKTHLDPRIGFLHTTNFRKFSLNLDVAEVFKPVIVDRVIFTLLNRRMLDKSDFMEQFGGIFLNDKGRNTFISEYENKLRSTIRHKGLKRNASYRRLIRLELYKIEKHLIGEKEYVPFTTRW